MLRPIADLRFVPIVDTLRRLACRIISSRVSPRVFSTALRTARSFAIFSKRAIAEIPGDHHHGFTGRSA